VVALVVGALGCKKTNESGADASADAGPSKPKGPGAWSVVAKGIADDGTMSDDAVLKAFAMTVAPLPGVDVPPGDETVPFCGTMARDAALARFDKFSPQQRDAITRALEPHEAPPVKNALVFGSRTAEGYGPEIERVNAWVSGFLGRPPVTVRVDTVDVIPTRATGDEVFADAGAWCPRQPGAQLARYADYRYGNAGENTTACACRVRIARAARGTIPGKFHEILVHELTHCYQYAAQTAGLPDAWVSEGHAYWVQAQELIDAHRPLSESLVPDAWDAYMIGDSRVHGPAGRLALGFQPHAGGFSLVSALQSDGFDVRQRWIDMMNSGSRAYPEIAGTHPHALTAWASQSMNEISVGRAWAPPQGPGLPSANHRNAQALPPLQRGRPQAITVPARAQVVANAGIGQGDVLEIDPGTSLGRVLFVKPDPNPVGFAPGAEAEWTSPGALLYCLKPDGCDVGTPIPLARKRESVVVAASASPGGASTVTLTLLSEADVRDSSTCVYGTWKYDDTTAMGLLASHVPPPARVRSVAIDEVVEIKRDGSYREDVRSARVVMDTGAGEMASTIKGVRTGRVTVAGRRMTASNLRDDTTAEAAIKTGNQWIKLPMDKQQALAVGAAFSGHPAPNAPASSTVSFRCNGAELYVTNTEGVQRFTRVGN
jgi:hypothetical protein